MTQQEDSPEGNSISNDHSSSEFPTEHGYTHHFPGVLSSEARRNLRNDAPPQPKPRRVLIVDDEQLIADTLAVILRNAGYETAVAYDGLNALEKCESFAPELVISDVVMPRMNGIEAAIQIRQRFPTCKVLLFSGQACTADLLEEARGKGYDFELLAKPIHPKELLSKLVA